MELNVKHVFDHTPIDCSSKILEHELNELCAYVISWLVGVHVLQNKNNSDVLGLEAVLISF